MLATVTFTLVLMAWGHARFVRIATRDEITEPWRNKVRKRWGYQSLPAKWIECPWCFGWWTAWPASAVAWFPIMGLSMWWLYPVAMMAIAHAAGYLNPKPATAGK